MSNTFLHGDLEVVVLMEIPSGFDGRIRPSNVCRLKKALYGFKQSRRHGWEIHKSYATNVIYT